MIEATLVGQGNQLLARGSFQSLETLADAVFYPALPSAGKPPDIQEIQEGLPHVALTTTGQFRVLGSWTCQECQAGERPHLHLQLWREFSN